MKRYTRWLHGTASDSIVLSLVRVIAALFGILAAKLLAVCFSLWDYGTYSQATLIASTVSTISILGLTDATNYYYNSANNDLEKQQYISTIFGIQYFIGLLSALLIIVLRSPLSRYFGNEDLNNALYLVAFSPLLGNLFGMLQVLVLSIGKAKVVAARNFIFSFSRCLFIAFAGLVSHSILMVLALCLVFDVVQAVFFYKQFHIHSFAIQVSCFNLSLVEPILRFSIPLMIFNCTNTLARDIDKYVIGFFTDTETLAIYSNAARVLPFDLISYSFMMVLTPILTRMLHSGDHNSATHCMRIYLRISYLITWFLVGGALITARELMIILYDLKYLPGLPIFIVYLIVDMVRFANFSIILALRGKTGLLVRISIICLFSNLILNVLAFQSVGVIGPAAVTLFISVLQFYFYYYYAANELSACFSDLFNLKEIVWEIGLLVILGLAVFLFKQMLYRFIDSFLFVFFFTYGCFLLLSLLFNRKRIVSCLHEINQLK